ncbi:peroxidase-related enzyme [Massilia sp. RP-1-19]|uniref:Peroxidase-related enzyme n=1 Tax=Massilia polaris TaxID=2728846 RepID=A0A848HD95_9BURK|nr:peroxidase-related enzyme [Massilia polaris]NML59796.1 peroxidase-related enzyme [Massilia polaris]
MSRIDLTTADTAPESSRPLLGQIHAAFGATPNMFRAVANSPAALTSMWSAFGALGNGTLGAKLGEQIAVAVADINDCEYCLAAHTALGRQAGASADEMSAAQAGQSQDPKTAAVLSFVTTVVRQRAKIAADDVDALRAAGITEGEVMEIMAHIALNLFTNYVNVALDVPVDFPQVKLRAK